MSSCGVHCDFGRFEEDDELRDDDFSEDDDEMGGDYNAEQYFDAGDDEGDGDGFADGGGGGGGGGGEGERRRMASDPIGDGRRPRE